MRGNSRGAYDNWVPTTNIVEAVLGRKHLKWDASWRLFAWLLDPKEGHGLGEKVLESFCLYTFGQAFPLCPIKLEYQLSPVKDGKGKWADHALAVPSFDAPTHIAIMDDIDRNTPGSRRKLDNLAAYRSLAGERFPGAIIRLVVLTNASEGNSIPTIYGDAALGPEAEEFWTTDGWKLLPFGTVGTWVAEAMSPGSSAASNKMNLFLSDFVEWSHSLDHPKTN
jgi:hypothetical protein